MTLRGPLHLGDAGSTIGWFGEGTSQLILEGLVTGGSLAITHGIVELHTANAQYTGPTVVHDGTLKITGDAQLQHSPEIVVERFATLMLDQDQGTQVADRVGDGVAIVMRGGEVRNRFSHETGPLPDGPPEEVSVVRVDQGASSIFLRHNSVDSLALTIGQVTREPGATITFAGEIGLTESRELHQGMIGAWATFGTDFASVVDSPAGPRLAPLSTTNISIYSADATTNLEVDRLHRMMGDVELNSLTFFSDGITKNGAVDLMGHLLTVDSGGTGGWMTGNLVNGRLTEGSSGELVFQHGLEDAVVSASIIDNSGGSVGVTVSGQVAFEGSNSYSGPTFVNGELIVRSADGLPASSPVYVQEGNLEIQNHRVRIDQAVVRLGGALTNNNDGSIDIGVLRLESGLVAGLVGNGTVEKWTSGHGRIVDLGNQSGSMNFTGNIEVYEGTLELDVSGSAALPTVRVHPAGRVAGNADAFTTIELRGGRLAGEGEFEAVVDVVEDSAIAADWTKVIQLGGPLRLRDATTLRVEGFDEQAKTRIHGTLWVGNNSKVVVDGGVVDIQGEIIANAAEGKLDFDVAQGSVDMR